MPEKVLFSWSGGKDSALALREILANGGFEIAVLLTTVTADYDRISMHGVRRALLEQQADSLGFPLEIVSISKNSSNEEYEVNMRRVLSKYLADGVLSVVIGDVFLEDVRQYRERNLAKIGMKGIFPLWKRDTRRLVHTFIDLGFEAIITCVDSKSLDKRFAGRHIDAQFLSDLPSTVDPCGENGEYHSFVYDGPIFRNKVEYTVGEVVLRDDRFYYCDLVSQ
jgi:uncharacterized protein (TIGR00290 family)